MSTSWKGLSKKVRPSPSKAADVYGIKPPSEIEEKTRQLADILIVNDLKEEYYYSQFDVAVDAFRIHREFADKYPDLYKEVLKILRPIILECQKVLAAVYLWDRNIDRKLALELLEDVRPNWKITFFYILKKQIPELVLHHKGWGRKLRRLASELIQECTPYHLIKYRGKLLSIARWSHISDASLASKYLFKDYRKNEDVRKSLIKGDPLWKEYFGLSQLVKEGKSSEEIALMLKKTNLPFTVLKAMLGKRINDPKIFSSMLHTLTAWETILSLKQIEERELLKNESVLEVLSNKIKPEIVRGMRIDIVELLQAFRKVETREAENILKKVLHSQISAISEALNKYVENTRVVVVFDVSGSMGMVSEWSKGLALATSQIKSKETILVAFADEAITLPFPSIEEILLDAMKKINVGGGTALGKGLIEALKHDPDIIFFISDFEGNIEPWSDKVYEKYVAAKRKFPDIISIKFVTSPLTAIGEPTAIRLGRWLGIPKEHKIVLRNIWDLPTMLEYIFNLLPILIKRAEKIPAYVV